MTLDKEEQYRGILDRPNIYEGWMHTMALKMKIEGDDPPPKAGFTDVMDAYFVNRMRALEKRIAAQFEVLFGLIWTLNERQKGDHDRTDPQEG